MIRKRELLSLAILVVLILSLTISHTHFTINSSPVYEAQRVMPKHMETGVLASNKSYDVVVLSWGYPVETDIFCIGNVDNDELPEVIVATDWRSIAIFDSHGLVKKKPLKWGITKLFAIDIDGDSVDEVVFFSSSSQLFGVWYVERDEVRAWHVERVVSNSIVSFKSPPSSFLIFTNRTHILILNNTGIHAVYHFNYSKTIWLGAKGDVDCDGYLEYLLSEEATSSGRILIWDLIERNLSTVTTTITYTLGLLPLDFDGDGADEILGMSPDKFGLIDEEEERWFMDANGTIIGACKADVDSNGLEEALISITNNGLLLFFYPKHVERLCSPSDTIPAVADFDADGSFEIAGFFNNSFMILNTSGGIEYEYPEMLVPLGKTVMIADLEGDGIVDAIAPFIYWGTSKIGEFRFVRIPIRPFSIGEQFSLPIDYVVNEYHDFEALTNILSELANKYPSMVKVFSIGKSWEGRDIWAVKITNGDGSTKPAILFIGAHHAREMITVENALYTMMVLVSLYGTHPNITELLDSFDFYFVPMLNPDGIEIALKQNDWQRKNARPVDDDGDGQIDEDPPEDTNGDGLIDMIYVYNEATGEWILNFEGVDNDDDGRSGEDWIGGVDLNRNYAFYWSNQGEYADPFSEIYSGPEPLSELETSALDKLMNSTRPLLAVSLHSGTRAIFFPFAVKYQVAFEHELFTEFAGLASYISGFPAMQCSIIYESYGAWDDHSYGFYNIFAFTIETFVNDSAMEYTYTDGKYIIRGCKWYFNPAPEKIEEVNKIVAETLLNMAYLMLKMIKSDKEPPSLTRGDVQVELHYNYVLVIARPDDKESGIQRVLAVVNSSEGIIEKEMFKNLEKRAWVIEIPCSNISSVEITAWDKAGLKSSVVITEINDTIGPDILSVWRKPKNPRIIDSVRVYAIIKDASNVKSATLQYSIEGGEWINITMTYVPERDYYIAEIPATNEPVLVWYRIIALDMHNNPSISDLYNYRPSADLSGPRISVVLDPLVPSFLDIVNVYADVYDESGVDTVLYAYWNGKEWVNETMELIGPRTYRARIPPQRLFLKVIVVIIANDTYGNVSKARIEYVVHLPIWAYAGIAMALVILIGYVIYIKKFRKS